MDIFKDYEVEGQLSIFDLTLPAFKIDKTIRLIELFAGVGSQAMALRDLGADFKHYRVVEFDKYAIASYNAIHGTDFPTMDITQVKGSDLGIVDTDKYCYIMTYSFPCQDLSVAGKQRGMTKGSGTRSGLLWEVERLLNEVENLPQVLLMENVPQVHGKKNMDDFQRWIDYLASRGYSNYWQDLNAKNYGVAQNRNRCFMVSILGDYTYDFPNPIPLKKTMKDYLEDEVDEKYYINNEKAQKLIQKLIDNGTLANTILDRQTDRQTIPYACNMADLLGIDRRIDKQNEQYKSLQMGVIPSGSEYRLRRMNGELTDSNGNYSQFNQERYKFFLEAPFEISDLCCDIMKKKPAHEYENETGRKPIIATMATESVMRKQKWLQEGCNAFDVTRPNSKPISFWTEQDVLLYIKENADRMCKTRINESKIVMFYGDRIVSRETGATIENKEYYLPICSVYGDVVTDYESMGQCENQMSFSDYGIFDNERSLLKTTGCTRTGCVLCGFGCHLEKEPNRFQMLKETHPKFHNLLYILKNNGVTYAEAIDWINEHGNMNIKY